MSSLSAFSCHCLAAFQIFSFLVTISFTTLFRFVVAYQIFFTWLLPLVQVNVQNELISFLLGPYYDFPLIDFPVIYLYPHNFLINYYCSYNISKTFMTTAWGPFCRLSDNTKLFLCGPYSNTGPVHCLKLAT